METINTNWTDENGNHQGGQSCGEHFTIAWQRGPLNEAGRNGAFLIEVLGSCLEWMRGANGVATHGVGYTMAYGIGYTIIFGSTNIPTHHKLETLKEVLKSCIHQVSYYQSQDRFACEENAQAIENLTEACEVLPDIYASIVFVQMAQSVLIMRRDRRANDGTLGTHQGEAE